MRELHCYSLVEQQAYRQASVLFKLFTDILACLITYLLTYYVPNDIFL